MATFVAYNICLSNCWHAIFTQLSKKKMKIVHIITCDLKNTKVDQFALLWFRFDCCFRFLFLFLLFCSSSFASSFLFFCTLIHNFKTVKINHKNGQSFQSHQIKGKGTKITLFHLIYKSAIYVVYVMSKRVYYNNILRILHIK